MFVVLLPNGNLRVPMRAEAANGAVGHGVVEIGPDNPDYARLREQAITEQEWIDLQQGPDEAAAEQEWQDLLKAIGEA